MKTTRKNLLNAMAPFFFCALALTLLPLNVVAQDPASADLAIPKVMGVVVPQSLKLDEVVSHPNYKGHQAIQFTLAEAQDVKVSLGTMDGSVEVVLMNGLLEAGTHYVILPDKKLPLGEYYCFLKGKDTTDVKNLVLVREKSTFVDSH